MKSAPVKFLVIVLHSLNLNSLEFLNAFAEFREATICFVMSVLSSNRMGKFGSHWTEFHEI